MYVIRDINKKGFSKYSLCEKLSWNTLNVYKKTLRISHLFLPYALIFTCSECASYTVCVYKRYQYSLLLPNRKTLTNVLLMPLMVWSWWSPSSILLIDNAIFVSLSVFHSNPEQRPLKYSKTAPGKRCFTGRFLPGFTSQISEYLLGNTKENGVNTPYTLGQFCLLRSNSSN